jgi:hypothetical protein
VTSRVTDGELRSPPSSHHHASESWGDGKNGVQIFQ